jgi:ADP-dependent NAD(P)H-hydrate dehydratase / NAD(P)H-hydrate epimerase
MKAITVQQMHDWEKRQFARGVSAETMMEQAGWGIACAVRKFFPRAGRVLLYLGKGHNAGDALCAARHLRHWGWLVDLRPAYAEVDWAALTRKQMHALEEVPEASAQGYERTVILDGLLGIGAVGELREPILAATEEMQRLRQQHAMPVIALDVPTGVNADTGVAVPGALTADITMMIGAPKIGLLKSTAVNHVGRLELIPLDGLEIVSDSNAHLITPQTFPKSLPLRAHDFHKGDAGKVVVIAGSQGMEGAALMTATAALRVGAGLVSLWVGTDIYSQVSARACPALMVQPYRIWRKILFDQADALAIGPGLGSMSEDDHKALVELLDKHPCPAVLDADALNSIARHRGHHCLQPHHVITPHQAEFTRLAPLSALRGREDACEHFSENSPAVLLYKGARTLVQQRSGPLYHNSTGHSGMATAGMGDVLTGVIAGLQSQGMSSLHAACAGAWVCGRAAEMLVSAGRYSAHSLIATDLYDFLGLALDEWRRAE